MNDKLVFIDTSAWIEYLKKTSHPVTKEIEKTMVFNTAATCRIVLAELFQGAKCQKEIDLIKDLTSVIKILEERINTWQEAGLLSNRLRKQGKNLHLIDCYLVVLAGQYNATVLSLDKHFPIIASSFTTIH